MKKIAQFPLFVAIAVLWSLLASPAFAQSGSTVIKEHRDWTAWRYSDGGNRNTICYMSSAPTKPHKLKKGATRGEVYFYITHRPKQNVMGEVSMLTGYTFKKGSEAVVRIGNKEIPMKTDGERAWPLRIEDSQKLVDLMKAGSKMEVRGTSSRGTRTTDTFSLSGVTAAYESISQTCK